MLLEVCLQFVTYDINQLHFVVNDSKRHGLVGLQNKVTMVVSSNGCSSFMGAPFCAVVQVYVED